MNHLKRRRILTGRLRLHGPLTVRELGEATGLDINTIGDDLRALETDASVNREELPGWRTRGAKQSRYRWSLRA